MIPRSYTDAEFAQLSFHDCSIWGIQIRSGDPDEEDWTNQLVLDIDFITEWGGSCNALEFHVAPATLTFDGVTDLSIHIDWRSTGYMGVPNPASIGRIDRERLADQRVHLDRPYYVWDIALNAPEGHIRFGALGFTLALDSEAAATGHCQSLSLRQRERMRGRTA